VLRDMETGQSESCEQTEHRDTTDQSEFLTDDREDEVSVRVRQEEPLRAPRAEADAIDSPTADRDQRLCDLIPRVRRVRPWIQEREDTRSPVRSCEREHSRRRDPDRRQTTEVLETRTADQQQSEGDEAEHDRRVEVGLENDEEPEASEHDEHW
jgi:hypothetical protein